jgi:hypothetical protein
MRFHYYHWKQLWSIMIDQEFEVFQQLFNGFSAERQEANQHRSGR